MNDMIQILMGMLGAFGFSILFNMRGWKLLLAALGGGLSWALYLVLEPLFPGEFTRYFISAFFVAVYAEVLARLLKTPATTFLISCIIPHIPGGALYHTMRYALLKEWAACFQQAFHTVMLALGLALGIVAVLSGLNVAEVVKRSIAKKKGA
ncbi:MAG: threonine/serine exporter family protein [Oscillospiraceae bacterium]|nr:threonine/serine exporter family protein [Oscillospiraceae bacterium]